MRAQRPPQRRRDRHHRAWRAPPGCVVKTEARSALVAAVGCLRRARWEEIPRAERDLLFAQIATAWEGGDAPPSVARAMSAQAIERGRTTSALARLIEDVVWIADPGTTVRINGLDYTPTRRGTVVIIEPGLLSKATPWVLSARAEVTAPTSVGRVLLRPPGSIAIPARKQGFRIASIPVATGVAFLPGTRLQGTVDVTLEQDRSRLRTRLRLPDDFAWATGAAMSAEAQMVASNKDGIELDGFGIEDVDAEILGVGVRIDYLRYVASQRRFEGRAKVSFQPLGAIDATMHVRDKTIELLDISYLPGAPGIKVAPGSSSPRSMGSTRTARTSCGSAERRRSPAGLLPDRAVASSPRRGRLSFGSTRRRSRSRSTASGRCVHPAGARAGGDRGQWVREHRCGSRLRARAADAEGRMGHRLLLRPALQRRNPSTRAGLVIWAVRPGRRSCPIAGWRSAPSSGPSMPGPALTGRLVRRCRRSSPTCPSWRAAAT